MKEAEMMERTMKACGWILIVAVALAPAVSWAQANQAAAPKKGPAGETEPVEKPYELPELTMPGGFKAELVYAVPNKEQGSWVAMTFDDKGRVIASDQSGGLYRVTLPWTSDAKQVKVERLGIDFGESHGLLYAFDSLYCVVNKAKGKHATGLYRLRDTDGDDQFDKIELLKKLEGRGEHGPHSLVLTEDKRGIYFNAGNHTKLPEGITRYSVPNVWDEDHLLPQQPDGRGHAANIKAPGGWICRIDPEGVSWELISIGYRNQYDIALNADGELFAYDADMEWDLGMPWYRPTRLNHVTRGSEFGWRTGTGKWPEYYPDSLGAVINLGPGSPTGAVFGYGAKFPAKYQKALYLLDWTYGTLYAIHLKPQGASYVGEREEFVVGKPLPLTDVEIGPDGAMYFIIGGRGTQSAMIRVSYHGRASTDPVEYRSKSGAKARALRNDLEAFHGVRNRFAVGAAWRYLGHADRTIRFAARAAIEAQPVERWRERLFSETDPQTVITGAVALARTGDESDKAKTLEALDKIGFTSLTADQRLELLRAYSLVFIRMGKPSDEYAAWLAKRLDAHYPNPDSRLNRELSRVLVYLDSPSAITKTLNILASAKSDLDEDTKRLIERSDRYGAAINALYENGPQTDQIHYAFVLRNATKGWTMRQYKQMFKWYEAAAGWSGGNSYPIFIERMKQDVLAPLTNKQRTELAPYIKETLVGPPKIEDLPKAQGPGGNWTKRQILGWVEESNRKPDFNNGKKMYDAALCIMCHRMAGNGGPIGPDLTGIQNRYTMADLLDNIIAPSDVVSDQYESTVLTLKEGSVV
jgi:hypothetical protein